MTDKSLKTEAKTSVEMEKDLSETSSQRVEANVKGDELPAPITNYAATPASAVTSSSTSQDPVFTTHSFNYEGTEREYLFVQGHNKAALVVLLHPFGGSPETTLQRFQALAKKGFSLAVPRGIENSWNGGACCGKAVQLGLDDSGFVRSLSKALLTKHNSVDSVAYGAHIVGYSNGGFLASKIALLAAVHDENWLKSVVIISGYSYDHTLYVSAIKAAKSLKKHGFSVLALHGAKDDAVRPEGCCKEIECCCQITHRQCFSYAEAFADWAEINRCKSKAFERGSKLQTQSHLQLLASSNVTCAVGSNCFAPVAFCEFPGAGHRLDEFVPLGQIVSEYIQSTIEHEPRVDVQNTIIRNPHTDPDVDNSPEEHFGGVLTIAVFLCVVFFFMSRIFKATRKGASPAPVPVDGSARERQSLTGRKMTSFVAQV